ncbi:hypothetical protein BIW11_06086 [Tropilaelaps mercedesae]|uniref:Ionotropic glutamate receptor C-terminal domain-containing protein n=1 Tax=Tropilaelaps mercedesae TaxID=418985 RepID=A0A1V9XZQ1_9ACAR|nr:hypothetical protein BIW11_06086 [Tropilaelaps mercedesae]
MFPSADVRYSLIPPADNAYGQVDPETGEFQGMPRAVVDGLADITGPLIVQEEFYTSLYQLTLPSEAFTRTVFIFGMKEAYVTATVSFTETVEISTWLSLLIFGVILIGLIMIFHKIVPTNTQLSMSFLLIQWSFTFFGILLQEATSSKPPRLWFERLVRGVWYVGCMLLSYIFLGTLRANLVVQTPTERIKGIDQFLSHPERPIYIGAKTPATWIIAVYPGEKGDRLRAHFARNRVEVDPFYRLLDVEVLEPVIKAKAALMFEELFLLRAIADWCVKTDYFIYIMPEEISRINGGLYTSRNLPIELNKELDRKMLWTQALGVPFMREREVLNGGHLGCLAGEDLKTSENIQQVTVYDLMTIYVSLILGLIISIVAFIAELVCSACVLHSETEDTQGMPPAVVDGLAHLPTGLTD